MLVIGDGLFNLLAAVSVEAACMGLGFAWFPEDRISAELDSGRLKPLRMREGGERWVTIRRGPSSAWRDDVACLCIGANTGVCTVQETVRMAQVRVLTGPERRGDLIKILWHAVNFAMNQWGKKCCGAWRLGST